MTIEWEEFLDPYIQAVGELKIKLRGIRKQYRKQNKHSPIEFVTGRVKPIESIKEKMARRGITYATLEHDLQDIAGLRVMVQFVNDVKGSSGNFAQTSGHANHTGARLHYSSKSIRLSFLSRGSRIYG